MAPEEHREDRDQGRGLPVSTLFPLPMLVAGRMGAGVSLPEPGDSILPLQEEEEPTP